MLGQPGSPVIKLSPARADEQAAAYFRAAPFERQLPAAEFESRLHAATDEWVREGIVTPEQAERIRARHPLVEPGPGAVATLLYAAAGVLLGAAGIALVAVGLEPEDVQLPFTLIALAFLGAAFVVHFALRKPLLGDALLVASMAPAVAAGFGDVEAYTLLGVVVPAGLLSWRRGTFVAPLGVIAFSIGAAIASFQWTEAFAPRNTDVATVPWAILETLLLVAVVALDRLLPEGRDDIASAGLAVVGLAVSLVFLFGEGLDLESEAIELTLGAVVLVVAAIGAWMRHRGVVLGATVALAVDAIVFGFDVGGVFTGTITLLAVAALLIWQAELVKRYFRG